MNIEQYRLFCMSKKGVTESFPFSKLPNVLMFKVMGKMFTATDVANFTSISVKSNSEQIDALRAKYSCLETQAYMNKNHWNKVVLDNSVPDSLIFEWLDTSYQLVIQKLTKIEKIQLNSV